jgi:hypothetical protein
VSEKKYKVIDTLGHVIADNMNLQTALLLIRAYCEQYFMEHVNLTLREEDTCVCQEQ